MATAAGHGVRGKFICELCDKTDNVNWRCMECCQNMCDSCNTIHSRTKPALGHHVVDINIWDSHRVDVQCPNHDGYELNLYCIECNKLECENCMKEEKKRQLLAESQNQETLHRPEEIVISPETMDREMHRLKEKILGCPLQSSNIKNRTTTLNIPNTTITNIKRTETIVEDKNGSKEVTFTKTYQFQMKNGKLETVASSNENNKEYHSIISEEDYQKGFDQLTKRVEMYKEEELRKSHVPKFPEFKLNPSPTSLQFAILQEMIGCLDNKK